MKVKFSYLFYDEVERIFPRFYFDSSDNDVDKAHFCDLCYVFGEDLYEGF